MFGKGPFVSSKTWSIYIELSISMVIIQMSVLFKYLLLKLLVFEGNASLKGISCNKSVLISTIDFAFVNRKMVLKEALVTGVDQWLHGAPVLCVFSWATDL